MAAYLVLSLISGIAFATTSLLGFGGGFWMAALWYVVGCWAGFAALLAFVLLTGTRQHPQLPHFPEGSTAG